MYECDELVQYYIQNQNRARQWRDTFPLNIEYHNDNILIPLVEKIRTSLIQHTSKDLAVDWAQLVRWPAGSLQETHIDDASDKTVFTSITYLNNEFSGGNTYIEDDIIFKSRKGRTVSFDGQQYPHGVTRIESGERYTLAVWYRE